MKRVFLAVLAVISFTAIAGATDIFVSPAGSDANSGSEDAPFLTIKKAIESAKAGTTIYLRGGTYRPAGSEIMREGAEGVYSCIYNLSVSGTAERPITISGYNDEKVTIDLSDVRPDARIIGFYVKADYWRLRKFDIVGIQVTQTGHTQSINVGLFGGSNCIVEQVNMHDGMGIGVYATRGSNNLILNCDAYNNYDPVSENGAGGNCDGFGFHLNRNDYTGNVIRGCRAWRNSDDGYDLISNLSQVVIENCWAWENGYDANRVSRGDGTGFKSGGYGMGTVKAGTVAPRNVVRNCVAWSNKQNGFYANHHLGGLEFRNNSAYR
ncbi:MAG: right-handed parallel beta-helix repeat-containing protein, partial [Duncaniella sp.]|nr:right-handed parallel beta-helix repeat-containing protein [Duncaniella sp.]